MPTPSYLTAVGFGSFPLELLGRADTFVQLRPEHVLPGMGPVLTQYRAPQIATEKEAKRDGSWEPRYGVEWVHAGRRPNLSSAELTTSCEETSRLMRDYGPREVDVTPEFVKELFFRK